MPFHVAGKNQFGTVFGHPIDRALRFNDGDSSSLSFTPASAGNRKAFVLEGWIKRGALGTTQYIWSAGSASSDYTAVFFDASDRLNIIRVISSSTDAQKITSAVYREPGGWMHIAVIMDAANTNLDVYVNGVEVTAFGTSNEPSNIDGAENNTVVHTIGARSYSATGTYFDGYLAQMQYSDGGTSGPNAGESNSTTGEWVPKAASVSGTNAYILDFSDDTSTTTLGEDSSGNGNDWTLNNLATTDSVTDTPTNNFPTWSPIDKASTTLSEANLKATPAADNRAVRATIPFPDSGKWYLEFQVSDLGYGHGLGIANNDSDLGLSGSAERRMFSFGSWYNTYNGGTVQYVVNGATLAGTNWTGASQPAANDIIMMAYDADNGSIWWGKNGTWFNSSGTANPATNTDPRLTGLSGTTWFPFSEGYAVITVQINCGQLTTSGDNADENGYGSFEYVPPSGFLALCTANMDDPGDSDPLTGSFTGNANVDGPFVWLGYPPDTSETSTINSNTITWGTHADALANGLKLRTSLSSYNASGSNTYSIAIDTAAPFVRGAKARAN